MVERISHGELVDYAVRLLNGKKGGPYKTFGRYIPDVFTSKTIVECKAWTDVEYQQFDEMEKIKGKKKVLLIHLPSVFSDIWLVAHHTHKKNLLLFKTEVKVVQKGAKQEVCNLCLKEFDANYKFCERLVAYICEECCTKCFTDTQRECLNVNHAVKYIQQERLLREKRE